MAHATLRNNRSCFVECRGSNNSCGKEKVIILIKESRERHSQRQRFGKREREHAEGERRKMDGEKDLRLLEMKTQLELTQGSRHCKDLELD